MLDKQFKHKAWFLNKNITVKEFLNYVLSNSGDFRITKKYKLNDDNLLGNPDCFYYLSDGRYSYKLDYQERNYLAINNEYFKSALPPINENYMMAIISKCGEPIPNDNHDIIYFSR